MSLTPEPEVILVAEDNDDDVVLLLRSFRRGSLINPVFVVRNGIEAIEYLRGEGRFSNREEYPLPALMLLDLRMPMMDGFEVLYWVRQHPTLRTLRIVMLTTSEDMRDINRAYQLGANAFLVKPTDLGNFTKINEALKGHWVWLAKAPSIERLDECAVETGPTSPKG